MKKYKLFLTIERYDENEEIYYTDREHELGKYDAITDANVDFDALLDAHYGV